MGIVQALPEVVERQGLGIVPSLIRVQAAEQEAGVWLAALLLLGVPYIRSTCLAIFTQIQAEELQAAEVQRRQPTLRV